VSVNKYSPLHQTIRGYEQKLQKSTPLTADQKKEMTSLVKTIFQAFDSSQKNFKIGDKTFTTQDFLSKISLEEISELAKKLIFSSDDAYVLCSGLDVIEKNIIKSGGHQPVAMNNVKKAVRELAAQMKPLEETRDPDEVGNVQEMRKALDLTFNDHLKDMRKLDPEIKKAAKKDAIIRSLIIGASVLGGIVIAALCIALPPFWFVGVGAFIGVFAGLISGLVSGNLGYFFYKSKAEPLERKQRQELLECQKALKAKGYTKEPEFRAFLEKQKDLVDKIKNNREQVIKLMNVYVLEKQGYHDRAEDKLKELQQGA
jgi:hypothetical protein